MGVKGRYEKILCEISGKGGNDTYEDEKRDGRICRIWVSGQNEGISIPTDYPKGRSPPWPQALGPSNSQ